MQIHTNKECHWSLQSCILWIVKVEIINSGSCAHTQCEQILTFFCLLNLNGFWDFT